MKYSLINEPWIRVIQMDGLENKVSLKDCFLNAHLYKCLTGENAHQCHAMYRLLFAIAHTVLSRYTADGKKEEICDNEQHESQDAIERWHDYYQRKSFCGNTTVNPFLAYFTQWEDRFYLIHEQYPFFQCNDLKSEIAYPASRLNGMTQESNNCISLNENPNQTEHLLFDEAARGLVYEMSYGNCGFKPTPGLGWVSQFDCIYAIGKNLFETIMLNTIMLQEGNALWYPDHPIWEEEPKTYWEQTEARKEIMVDNFAGLLTVPTRKMKLLWNPAKEYVTSYHIEEGTRMKPINGELEPFAAWTRKEGQPKRFQNDLESRQVWREFPKFFVGNEKQGTPGVITWLKELKANGKLPSKYLMTVCTSSIKFKTLNSVVRNVYTDDFTFYADILSERSKSELNKIADETIKCKEISNLIFKFMKELALCENKTFDRRTAQYEIERFYSSIDIAFRRWVVKKDVIDESASCEWRAYVLKKARDIGERLILRASNKAITGRMVSVGGNDVLYTAYKSLDKYMKALNKLRLEEDSK